MPAPLTRIFVLSIGLLAGLLVAPVAQAAAPAASPANLYVTVTGTSGTASWDTTADATGYVVTAYSAASGGTSQIACTTAALNCTFTANSTHPFYAVKATNGDGTSPESTRIRLCNGSSDLCARPFNETVFPGTHNAMASDDAWGPFGSLNPITNQTFTIRGQLDRGIRAVNFDVYYGRDVFLDVWNADGPTRSGVEPYLCHTLCTLGATRLEDAFEDIVSFLQANPHEVVIVYLEDYISVADIQTVVDSSGLDNYLVNWSGTPVPLTTDLGTLIDSGKRAVLVSQNVNSANATPWLPRFSNVGMDTEYAFDDTSQLTTSNAASLQATCDPTPWGRYGNGRLFLMQHFITDPIASVSDSAVVNTKAVLVQRALACRDRRGVLPSILLVDYFEEGAADGGVLGAARALNNLYSPTAPRVASVSPSSGVAGGGTSVTITGTNLTGTTSVTVGSSPATSVTVVSDSTITATTPAGSAGAANVTVTTAAGSMMKWSGFTYGTPDPLTDPDITGVAPTQGSTAGGTTITVTGINVGTTDDVLVGGAPASSVTVVNATTVTAVTPEGLAGTVDVAVRTDTGYDTLAQSFTYVTPAQPSTPSNNSSTSTPTSTSTPATSPVETEQAAPSTPAPPGRLSPQALAVMSVQEIAGLRPADGALLSVSAIRVLTPEQLAAMQPETVRRLRPQVIAALTAEQVAGLAPAALRLLRPEQAASLTPRQVAEFAPASLRKLSPAAVRSLSPKTFRALTPRQLEALLPRQVRALDPDLVDLLTRRQLQALQD